MTALAPANFSEVLGTLQKLEIIVNRYFERRDVSQDNKDALFRLERDYKVAAEMVQQLESLSTPDFVTVQLVKRHATSLQYNLDKLTELQPEIERAGPFNRVRRVKQVLDSCEVDVNKFFEFLTDNVSPKLTETSDRPPDKYVPDNNVPSNPPRLTLDYNSTCTCENKLKAAVLKTGKGGVIGVVASGQGGVGKTCAMRGLATDGEVKERYPGGTLYIQLGNSSKSSDIIKGIQTIVERTGGLSLAERLGSAKLHEVCNKASLWFRAHACLFLIDDIWWANGIDSTVFKVLESMVNDTSRLVFTTRDKRFLSLSSEVIEFAPKDPHSDISRQMLMTHAEFDWTKKLEKENEKAVKGIMDICQGLPLAFGIAGASVRNYCLGRIDDRENGWQHFHDLLCSKTVNIAEGELEVYGPMRLIVDNSLDVLESENSEGRFHERFRALCVLQRQQMVPIGMLNKLWGVQSLKKTGEVVKKLDEVSIIRKLYKERAVFIQLHDRILDIAVRKASDRYEMQRFFKTLVENYMTREPRQRIQDAGISSKEENNRPAGVRKGVVPPQWLCKLCCGGMSDRENTESDKAGNVGTVEKAENFGTAEKEKSTFAWWNEEDDGYLHDNICRALQNGGYHEELVWLLSKPQWIVQRLQKRGTHQVEQDLEHGKAVAREVYRDKQLLKHLEMVGKAIRMGYSYVHENKREAWFQIHGRLLGYARKCERTERFVREIEECAPRPWAEASMGLLEQAGGPVSDILQSSGRVLCVFQNEEKVRFVSTNDNGEPKGTTGVTEYNIASGLICFQTLDGDDAKAHGLRKTSCCAFSNDAKIVVTGHSSGRIGIWDAGSGRIMRCNSEDRYGGGIKCIATSGDGTWAAFGSWDGTVRILDINSGKVKHRLRGHTGIVTCVAMSRDGKRVVSGCLDAKVLVWDLETDEKLGKPLIRDEARVRCVAMNGNGKRVAVGEDGDTVRVWDVDSREAVGQPFFGHTDEVRCVAISTDGGSVVSGSDDKTVRVWCVDSGEPVGRPLVGHTGSVMCVAMSMDMKRVVSGGNDKTLRLWDVDMVGTLEQPFVDEIGLIKCVFVSEDGRRVVSGSDDQTVRIWDVGSGEQEGQPLVGHTDSVMCVTISGNGKRVASGSSDKTVRVWEVDSGKGWQPLVGHTGWVECITISKGGKRVVSGSSDTTIRVWDVDGGGMATLNGHTNWVRCVAMSSDGKMVVSGGYDKTVRLWDVGNGKAVGLPFRGHSDLVTCVSVSEKGIVMSGSRDKTVRVWRMGLVLPPIAGSLSGDRIVSMSDDGRRVLAFDHGMVVLVLDPAKDVVMRRVPSRRTESAITCAAMSRDGMMLVFGSMDGTVRVGIVETGAVVEPPFLGHTRRVVCVAMSTNGRRAVSGSMDDTVRIWDVGTRKAVGSPLLGHSSSAQYVDMSGDGRRVVSGSLDDSIRVWDVGMSNAVGPLLLGHTGWLFSVSMSKDGRRVVSASIDKLCVWDVESQQAVRVIRNIVAVTRVMMSGDGMRVFSFENKTIRIWDIDGEEAFTERTFLGDPKLKIVAMSRGGGHAVLGSSDSVQVWDMFQPECLTIDNGLEVCCVQTTQEGSRVVSYDTTGLGKLWETTVGKCMMTSQDEAWQSTLEDLALPSSGNFWEPRSNKVKHRCADGKEIVLGTCESTGQRFGNRWFSSHFTSCEIVSGSSPVRAERKSGS